jgi:hypothetical protein
MLSVAKRNPVPPEPGHTIIQVWKTGRVVREDQSARETDRHAINPLRFGFA